jgi:hypothetical protein
VAPERLEDLKYARRFRKGELVWFRIDTINPPTNDQGLPSITHWPGLVSYIIKKTSVVTEKVSFGNSAVASASLRTAWTMAGGVPPEALRPAGESKTVTWWQYHIRPLGFFTSKEDVVKDLQDLLPYSLGDELLGGEAGWDKIGTEGTRVMNERVSVEVREIRANAAAGMTDEVGLDIRWRSKWAARIRFHEMPKRWEDVVFRLAVALKMGYVSLRSLIGLSQLSSHRKSSIRGHRLIVLTCCQTCSSTPTTKMLFSNRRGLCIRYASIP